MLNSKYRFHSRGGVRHTYQKGKSIRTPMLTLVYSENNRGFLRFAVIVRKKLEKTAVGRNRIRRRIYEAIRLELKTKNISSGDFLFLVNNKAINKIEFNELRSIIYSLLEQSGLN